MITTFILGFFAGIASYSLVAQVVTHKDERPDLRGFGGPDRDKTLSTNRNSRRGLGRNFLE
jgi:hypothetical protein